MPPEMYELQYPKPRKEKPPTNSRFLMNCSYSMQRFRGMRESHTLVLYPYTVPL